MYQRDNGRTVQFGPALKRIQFGQESIANNLAAEPPDQFRRGRNGPTGRQNIIDDQHPLSGADRIFMDLEEFSPYSKE